MSKPTSALVLLGGSEGPFQSLGAQEDNDDIVSVVKVDAKDKLSSCLSDLPACSLKSITLQIQSILYFDPMSIAGLIEPLDDKNGILRIVLLPSPSTTTTTNKDEACKVISKSFLLAGLIAQSEQRQIDGTCIFVAIKKEFEQYTTTNGGEARRLNLDEEEEKKETDYGRVLLKNNDDDDDDDNMIDEDALLDDDIEGNVGDMLAPPDMTARTANADDDCGGRKACDNCTCGRAEREKDSSTKSKQEVIPTSSACGNCAKGDAFRCASCPYLGKPAFKPGEEHLVLDLTDDI